MKTIHSSNFNMEDYEPELLGRIPPELLADSEMHEVERRFINGLIRYHQPKRLLEIGVSKGSGSIVLLNAIQDIPDAHLTSIDISEKLYSDKNMKTGATALKVYDPIEKDSQWTLLTGKDLVEIMDTLDGGPFDFCVIDTAHYHPIESLNFLVALPYLTDDAVVVLHDIANYLEGIEGNALATKLLFDCITADKLTPKTPYRFYQRYITTPNIGAFQITKETKKHIASVFSMLSFPWGGSALIGSHMEYFIKHYSEHQELYRKAVFSNITTIVGSHNNKANEAFYALSTTLITIFNKLIQSNNTMFYGAGSNCRTLLEIYRFIGIKPPCEIWDINAEKIKDINGIPVVLPNYGDTKNREEKIVIITVTNFNLNDSINNKIITEFRNNGFPNIFIWHDIQLLLQNWALSI